jgi:ABC-type transporter Mla maintaining outer membrane lipid asymmetry ATPase subunit MlaF
MMADTLISCRNLTPTGLLTDFKGSALDFELARGELVNIIGPVFEDKSTWLKTMCGLNEQATGEVYLLGVNTHQLDHTEWAQTRMKVAYVHADTALLSAANGLMNVLAPAIYHRIDEIISKQLLAEHALDLLEEIDPELNLDDLPAYISEDQRFKIAVARALMLDPDVLVLDNPFINFDRNIRKDFQNYLNSKIKQGLSILMVTQDIRYALNHSDRIIYVDHENLHIFDSVADLRHSDIAAITRYLGQYPDH